MIRQQISPVNAIPEIEKGEFITTQGYIIQLYWSEV